MTKTTKHRLYSVIGLMILAVAILVLSRELRRYELADVIQEFRDLPAARFWTAGVLVVIDYFVLTLFDYVGVIYSRRRLDYPRTAFVSFVAYAFSNSISYPAFSGGGIRYRFYSRWGFSVPQILLIMLSCGSAYFLGMGAVGALSFILFPPTGTLAETFPPALVPALGIGMLVAVLAYVILVFKSPRRVLRWRQWKLPIPRPRIALLQILVGSLDWTLTAATLYVLLPSAVAISFPAFLGLYVLSQCGAIISHVPGGVGVLETLMVLLLEPVVEADKAMGALIAFRILYYLIPFAVALVTMGVVEIIFRRKEGSPP